MISIAISANKHVDNAEAWMIPYTKLKLPYNESRICPYSATLRVIHTWEDTGRVL